MLAYIKTARHQRTGISMHLRQIRILHVCADAKGEEAPRLWRWYCGGFPHTIGG